MERDIKKHRWHDDALNADFRAVADERGLHLTAIVNSRRFHQDERLYAVPDYFQGEFFRLAARVRELEAGVSAALRAAESATHACSATDDTMRLLRPLRALCDPLKGE